MSLLPAQLIRARVGMIEPFCERGVAFGKSFGLDCAGYDFRNGKDVWILPFGTALSFTIERFRIPLDLKGVIVTKSTWARRFKTMPSTRAEPGWEGHLTLEFINHRPWPIRIRKGEPAGSIEFLQLSAPTEQPYGRDSKYQNQPAKVVPAKFEAAP